MPCYALSITPLIQKVSGNVQQAWYADDAQAAGQLENLRQWWDKIAAHGPGYGYHANSSKTILVVKPEKMDEAKRIFESTGIIIKEGTRDLGAVLFTKDNIQKHR
jgi:hypothetical protein